MAQQINKILKNLDKYGLNPTNKFQMEARAHKKTILEYANYVITKFKSGKWKGTKETVEEAYFRRQQKNLGF